MITVIGNLKGGTGKSTVTFNLALWIATRHNKHVVVYDLDPQATTTDAFQIRQEEGHLPIITPQTQIASLCKDVSNTEVLIDIGLADKAAMEEALRLADRLLMPIAPSQADIWSTQRFLKMVTDIRAGQPIEMLAVINRADTHKAVRETEEAAEAVSLLPNVTLVEPRLYMRTTYRRSFSEGLAVFEMEPRSKAAGEIEALGKKLYPC
jgi:chromosome partitioning protein